MPTLIKLQRANETAILEMNEKETGVQTLLHAAAVVLQRSQSSRLCAAGMFSKMGDGSSDRRTTEQVQLAFMHMHSCTCIHAQAFMHMHCCTMYYQMISPCLPLCTAGDHLRSLPNHPEADHREPPWHPIFGRIP